MHDRREGQTVPTISETMSAQALEGAALAWYLDETRVPQAFRRCHPLVIATARDMCGGDWRRCVLDADGAIVVHAEPKWQPESEAR